MERSSARARIGAASIAVSSNGLSGPVWGRAEVVRFSTVGRIRIVFGCQDQGITYAY